jgi:hypothetical protein
VIAHDQLMVALHAWGAEDATDRQDRRNSISSKVIRCRYQGQLTVAVGAEVPPEKCIGAVLDVLDLHASGGNVFAGRPVAAADVSVVLAERAGSETLDAIGTLVATLRNAPTVHVYQATESALRPAAPLREADFSASEKARRYLRLMERLDDGPPELLRRVLKQADRGELRAYPMLTGHPWWSLRLEGLEVGRFRPGRGWLDVGRVGRTGNESEARATWRSAVGEPHRKVVTDEDEASVSSAVTALGNFADAWLDRSSSAAGIGQNEHALESRILRGACPIEVGSGRLQLLQPDDGVTNWGSQFPTRWGHTDGNAARYLDALMRQGPVPWAVEMKVEGSGGVGRYYRHAVGQAVLYRHFIRSAAALDPWFARHGLDREAVRAAVVVPDLSAQPRWRDRLEAVCAMLGVKLVEVPQEYAVLR